MKSKLLLSVLLVGSLQNVWGAEEDTLDPQLMNSDFNIQQVHNLLQKTATIYQRPSLKQYGKLGLVSGLWSLVGMHFGGFATQKYCDQVFPAINCFTELNKPTIVATFLAGVLGVVYGYKKGYLTTEHTKQRQALQNQYNEEKDHAKDDFNDGQNYPNTQKALNQFSNYLSKNQNTLRKKSGFFGVTLTQQELQGLLPTVNPVK